MSSALIKLLQAAIFAGGAFALFALLYSHLKFERLTQAKPAAKEGTLLPSEHFVIRIARRMGGGVAAAPQVCVFVVAPPPGATDGAAAQAAIRGVLRRDDEVAELEDGRVGILAAAADQHAEMLARRILRALSGSEAAAGHVGIGCYPRDTRSADPLLHMAAEALSAGLREGSSCRFSGDGSRPAAAESGAPAPEDIELLDPLTLVLSASRLPGAVSKYLARCHNRGKPAALLHVDVDDLDAFNRRHGRDVGDRILGGIGRILSRVVRESDLIGRVGADDFVVVTECPAAEAVRVGERVLEAIRDDVVRVGASRLHVTASAGVAGHPEHGETLRELLLAAEAALVAARRRGPNVCVAHDGSIRPSRLPRRPSGDRF